MSIAGNVITRKRKSTFVCSHCKETIDVSHTLVDGYCGGVGYARPTHKSKRKVCYRCCAKVDSKWMDKYGKITLYLVHVEPLYASGRLVNYKVTNWPGTLSFTVINSSQSKNNFGATRTDVWFLRQNGTTKEWEQWHGVHVGDDSQLVRCKRAKS